MDIVREIRENREIGAIRLENEYRSRVMAYALRVCNDRVEAESLVTRAFAEAVNRIESLNDPDAFFGWLCGIVNNLHNMSVRRKEHGRVFYTDEPPDQSVDGDRKVVEAVDATFLHDAIAALPPDLRESLMLRYFMDLPLSRIAKLLSLPIGTVKSRLHYARVALAMRLGAKLKKPAVALIAAGLFLLAATAAVVVGVISGGEAETFNGTITMQETEETDEGHSVDAVDIPSVPSVSSSSSDHQITEGKTGMKKKSIIGSYRKLMNSLTAVAMMSLAANGAEIDPYIESAGTTGIDTGYHLTPNSRLEIDFALTTADQAKQCRLFGPDYNNSKLGLTTGLYLTDSLTWGFGVGDGTSYGGHWAYYQNPDLDPRTYIPADTERHQAVYDISRNRFAFITAGVTNWTHTTTYAFTQTSAQPVTLFARYRNEAAAVYELPIKARIYGMKIYEDNVLARDFEPCMMDGLAGFRDRVTEGFVAGGKAPQTFTAGGDYATYESPYVATPSDNSAYYIDTEYQASSNTCVMLDCAPLGTWTSGMSAWYLFYGYGKRPFSGYISGAGYGTQNVTAWDTGVVGLANLGAGVRRTFALDNFNHTAFALVAGVTNGVKTVTVSDETHPATTYTVKIAANYKNDSNFVPMKVYGCKIYESDVLVHDFVPCVKDGIAGLKDRITGLFVSYPSDKARITSNSLSVGGNILVDADPYIQGSGANGPYIVTDYKPCGTTRAEIDFQQTAVDTVNSHYPFSIHAGSSDFKFGIFALASSQRYGYNCTSASANWTHSGMPAVTNVRTRLILDAKNKKYHSAEAGRTNATFTISQTYAEGVRSQYNLPIFSTQQDSASDMYQAANRMPMKLYSFKLYEDDVLVRDYVPAVSNGVAGLQDRLPGGKFLAPATGSFTYGGVFPVEVSQSATKVSARKSVTLTAFAPGATSYRWLKNGESIPGGENGALTVNWRKLGKNPTDTYQALALFSADGVTAEGEPSATVTVENLPMGVIFSVR